MITFLTRFRIGPRLAAAFAILVLGLIGMGLYGSFNISCLATDLGEIKNSRVPKVERLVEMADNINLIARQTRNILIFDNLERQQEWIASIHKAVDANTKLFALVKPEIRSDEGRKLVAQAEATMKIFDQDLTDFLARSQDGDVSVATGLLDQKLRPSQLKLTAQLDNIKSREIQHLGQQADQAIAASHRAQWIGLAVISALILLCTWMSWLITRSIVGPMQRALREANRIAEGDLSANLQVRGRDEAAEMLQAMMTMQAGLRDIVAEVRELCDA
ncbi:MAG TPA: MCP four helix bundle domain-containing protein [Burkholderiaceae bacterium]|jgi:methyl-accepting chemotaxis protein